MSTATATKMTDEEKEKIMDAYTEARERGDLEEACKLAFRLPIHRALVPFVRKYYSEERIKELGLILTEAEG